MYHFIGIKGSGMSSLAILMKKLGYNVQGSDYDKHYFTEEGLIKNDIKILSFKKENIKENMIIIKGNMFNEENIEVKEAINKQLVIYTYQEMISEIIKNFNVIAVSGCHGKTTTSSLLAHVIDANYLIGDGSGGCSNNNFFVLEACEYKRHFLSYYPNYTIITNIDLDHVDYYKNIDDVINAYSEFIKQSNIIIACGDDQNIKKLTHTNMYFYGIDKSNYFQARNIKYYELGIAFDFYIKDKYIYNFELPFYGKHMVLNSLAVISVCYLENYDLNKINKKLKTFKGAKRRFNEQQILDNIIIDDYAHHPNEVEAVINAVKQKYPNKQIIAIFEPHTYSRTKKFGKEIARKLSRCDYVYVMDIYPSRENQQDYEDVKSNIIIDKMENGESINKNEINKLLVYRNSVILFMSPNDLKEMQKEYIELYNEKYKKSSPGNANSSLKD